MATYFARSITSAATALAAARRARFGVLALTLCATAVSAQLSGIKPSSPQLPNAILGKMYSVTFTPSPPAVGFNIFWFTNPGCLSGSGLTFTDNGDNTATIQGIATGVGTYTCTVTAEVADPSTVSKKYTLRVVKPCEPPQITSGEPPAATAGVPYQFTVTATGKPPLDFAAMGLPAGLTINSATGVISGTPPLVGTNAISIVVSGCGRSALQELTLVVGAPIPPSPAAVTLTLSSTPNPSVFGQSVDVVAHASGGTTVPTGTVLLCVTAPGQYCAPPVGTPPPGTPPGSIPPQSGAPLDSNGNASFGIGLPSIQIYTLQAYYGGDATHLGASAAPVEQFVIKGVLIPAAKAQVGGDPPGPPATIPTLSRTALALLAFAVATAALVAAQRRRRTRGR